MEQQTLPPEISQPTPTQNAPSCGLWIIISSLLIVILAIAATVYVWMQLRVNQQQLAHVERTLVDMRLNVKQQHSLLQNTQKQVLLLQEQSQRDGWVLTEVNYLVEQATYKLKFDHDAALAMQFLQLADERIAQGSSALLPLRQGLAQDMMALNAVPRVDVPGLVLRLAALSQQMSGLPQVPSAPPETTLPASVNALATPAHSMGAAAWDKVKQFALNVGVVIRSMVVITHNQDKSIPFLLTDEQRDVVVMHIQAQLTLAQWAVIHRQTQVYQQSLKQASAWLNTYFFKQSPAVIATLDTLQQLQKVVIDPVLPDISHSLDALRKAQQAALKTEK